MSGAAQREEYGEGLALCARDAGLEPGRLRVLRVDAHYKSRQVYVSTGDPTPAYVIKLNDMAWNPEREYEGYAFLERALSRGPAEASDEALRLGAIRPVGFGVDPAWLVTAFQPGRSARPEFDAGTAWRSSSDATRAAVRRARGIAAWSARTRRCEPLRHGGPGADALLADLHRHVGEMRRHLGARAATAAEPSLSAAERLLADLPPPASERLHWRFANHGDLAPQNFLVGADATLYALDLENFGFAPLHLDLSMFRARLETYALRGAIPRRRATEIWKAFLDETRKQEPESSDALLVMAHLQRMLAYLAWLRNPTYLAKHRPRPSLATRLRQALWLRARLAWLRELPADPPAAIRRFRDVL